MKRRYELLEVLQREFGYQMGERILRFIERFYATQRPPRSRRKGAK